MRRTERPEAWEPEVIDQAVPPLPEAPENGRGQARSGGVDDEPPVKLSERALRVWRGEEPKAQHGGPDRSGSLLKIGRVLFDAGANRTVIVGALAERDKALGWGKYTGRADAEKRYHEIVDELERNGRGLKVVAGGSERRNRAGGTGFHRTDLGNAERFVDRHGENVRYCYPWSQWFVWEDGRWQRDESGKVQRLAKETARSIYREAADAEEEAERKALARHATRSEAATSIRALLELAKSEVSVSPDEFDRDPWLLNMPNGTLDLRTGELLPHQREDMLTKMAGAEYDPGAEAPTWEAFLRRVQPEEEVRAFMRRAAGYSASGDTSEQCMFINYGSGANGKSTFQEALSAALGAYALRTPTETLLARRAGGVPNDVARLKGARCVSAAETEEGRHLAEATIKDLTGQDTISARYMRAEWFDFTPTHKLWLSTNHKPEIRGTDNAIWRRIRLVSWSVTISSAEQHKQLSAELRAELPGILAWVARGCLEWQREGLRPPEGVERATGEYREEMDILSAFIADCCEVTEDGWTYARDLYTAYRWWCAEVGERPESQRRFGGQLKERYASRRGGARGAALYDGLRLTDEAKGTSEGWSVRRK